MITPPILLAIPNDVIEEMLVAEIKQEGFSVLIANSYKQALEIIKTQNLLAVIMLSEWAMPQSDGNGGLMKFLKNRIPTVSLITHETYKKDHSWFDELYDRPRHEYLHLPADIHAIVTTVKNGIMGFE